MIGSAEVIVYGLRDTYDANIFSVLFGVCGKLHNRIHGVIAANVEEGFDIMLSEAVHDLFIYRAVRVRFGKLISA